MHCKRLFLTLETIPHSAFSPVIALAQFHVQFDIPLEDRLKARCITFVEGTDRGVNPLFAVDAIETQTHAVALGDLVNELAHGPAIAFTKGMDGVQFTEMMRTGVSEFRDMPRRQPAITADPIEADGKLAFNMLRTAKERVSLRKIAFAKFTGPGIDIAENMSVNSGHSAR
jgi:hypothetical protein